MMSNELRMQYNYIYILIYIYNYIYILIYTNIYIYILIIHIPLKMIV